MQDEEFRFPLQIHHSVQFRAPRTRLSVAGNQYGFQQLTSSSSKRMSLPLEVLWNISAVYLHRSLHLFCLMIHPNVPQINSLFRFCEPAGFINVVKYLMVFRNVTIKLTVETVLCCIVERAVSYINWIEFQCLCISFSMHFLRYSFINLINFKLISVFTLISVSIHYINFYLFFYFSIHSFTSCLILLHLFCKATWRTSGTLASGEGGRSGHSAAFNVLGTDWPNPREQR